MFETWKSLRWSLRTPESAVAKLVGRAPTPSQALVLLRVMKKYQL
jgi:hypothetical protein